MATTKGDPVVLIQVAVGVLGAGLVLAGVTWAVPHVRQWRSVRRFRRRLAQLELVVMIWEKAVAPEDWPEPRPEGSENRRYNNPG